ncbi:30S ribosomal protein S3ae [archaeon]|nr:30S ribosomal protein S3ae [archaeon]
MVVKKRKTAEAWKKKEWFTLAAPREFEEKPIGNTPADRPERVVGRVAEISLRELTGNINHQFVKLKLLVREVKGKTAYTDLVGFELMREYLRRNVRRRRSIIKSVQFLKTSDEKRIKVTTYVFTTRKIESSKKNLMRRELKNVMNEIITKDTFINAVEKCVFGGAAGEVFKKLKVIAPVRRVEVYKCELAEIKKKETTESPMQQQAGQQ